MAVRGIHHQHVDAGLDQAHHALVGGAAADADRRTDAQAPVGVLAGVRVALGLEDVLRGDHAAQAEGVIDHQHLLDAVAVQQLLDVGEVGALEHRHQLALARHDRGDRLVQVGREAHVATGDDADQLALAVQHRHAGEIALDGQADQVADGAGGVDGDRLAHHAALEALHGADLFGLLLGRHVLVHDADAALLGDRDRELGLGDRVHGRRHQGDVEGDLAGQAGLELDVLRHDFRFAGHQQHVIKGKRFFLDPQHGNSARACSLKARHYTGRTPRGKPRPAPIEPALLREPPWVRIHPDTGFVRMNADPQNATPVPPRPQ